MSNIAAGARLGSYEVLSAIGAGGMGEVYKARDTRLDRIVAIKVLPPDIASSPDLQERFAREAKTIASLAHPSICTLYDVGHDSGTDFLVLEYLEGETLEQRLTKGALPIDQALTIAIQIADALAAAHRAGVVHRDLKPGNIMLTRVGAKLLDFGLARTGMPAVAGNLSMAPTTPANLTVQGTILGTLQYMAPEQLEGQEADARTDIFALGAVLFEMVTGRKAFEAKSQASLIAAILERDTAPVSAIAPGARVLDEVIRRSLAKTADNRWQSAADLAHVLRTIAASGFHRGARAALSVPASPHAAAGSFLARLLPWAVAAAIGGALIGMAFSRTGTPAKTSLPNFRVDTHIGVDSGRLVSAPALSRDGATLAFAAISPDGVRQLYVRRLDQRVARPLAGTQGAETPFFSPDGAWIGYYADGRIKKVPVAGGDVAVITESPAYRGWTTWSDDNRIINAVVDGELTGRLMEVPSGGGTLHLIGKPDAFIRRWPSVLPGSNALLYAASAVVGNYDNATIMAARPGQDPTVVMRRGYAPRYASSGHLLYIREQTLYAVPFDASALTTGGQPVRLLDGVEGDSYSVSDTGVLAYVTADATTAAPLQWMDRGGKITSLHPAPLDWNKPMFSPDGRRLALMISSAGNDDVWVMDVVTGTLARLTSDPAPEGDECWTPDGRWVAFTRASQSGGADLMAIKSDGTGNAQLLLHSDTRLQCGSFHPTEPLMVIERDGGTYTVALRRDPDALRVVGDPVLLERYGRSPSISPDGRWLAFWRRESSGNVVYVRPLRGSGGPWLVSNGTRAEEPQWSVATKELMYRADSNRLMVVPYVVRGDTFEAASPQPWSLRSVANRPAQNPVALHPDGQRIVMAPRPGVADDHVTVIFNIFDELNAKAPVK